MSLHRRADRENDMPRETRLTHNRIDQFVSEACQACPIRAGLKTEPQRIDLI